MSLNTFEVGKCASTVPVSYTVRYYSRSLNQLQPAGMAAHRFQFPRGRDLRCTGLQTLPVPDPTRIGFVQIAEPVPVN